MIGGLSRKSCYFMYFVPNFAFRCCFNNLLVPNFFVKLDNLISPYEDYVQLVNTLWQLDNIKLLQHDMQFIKLVRHLLQA